MIEKSSPNTTSWIEISKCYVMRRHSICTWRHEVKELTIHILASRCDRKMILFLFLWYFESTSSNILLIFHLYDAVTSWRHVMTSQNLIYLSQLVDVLGSWFFFCFHGFLGHWVQKYWWFFLRMMSWRHNVMSWRHRDRLTYLRLWIHWKEDRVQDSMVFLVAYSRNVSAHVFVERYHVMTSRHDVTSLLSITLQYLVIL